MEWVAGVGALAAVERDLRGEGLRGGVVLQDALPRREHRRRGDGVAGAAAALVHDVRHLAKARCRADHSDDFFAFVHFESFAFVSGPC